MDPHLDPNRVIHGARKTLGHLWGFGRELHSSELGRALGFTGRDPGRQVRQWETGEAIMPGPARSALQMMLRGVLPPTALDTIRQRD